MKATPHSTEQYFPMSMASGRDAVLIDYGGSNFVSINGHSHMESHQNAAVGWYKSAHIDLDSRNKAGGAVIQPAVMAGIQVKVYGAPAEPTYFEQEFIPEDATTLTLLTFRYGMKLKITSFFTYDDSIWGERIEVIEAPTEPEFKIGFRVSAPLYGARMGGFTETAEAGFAANGDRAFDIDYKCVVFTGKGRLMADRPFDEINLQSGKGDAHASYAEGMYSKIKPGDVMSRVMILLGDNEKHISFDELCARAESGFDTLHEKHKAMWQEYFSTAYIETPDGKTNDIFKLSRYLVKAHQHPESGIVTLGMQPYHWKGAISCSWDEEFSHEAQLVCGNFKESENYTEQYMRQAPECRRLVNEHGYPGVAFTGWTTLAGEFCGWCSMEEWLLEHKPMFSAYAIFAIHNEWRLNPNADIERYREVAVDVLRFFLAKLIKKGDDGLYYVKDVKDGNESGVVVELDTSTQVKFGKAFSYVGEMYGIEEYSDIGRKMLLALERNRRPDGLLSSSGTLDAPFAHMGCYYYTYDDGLLAPELIPAVLDGMKTPWGYDSVFASEEYRHWPWHDMNAARALIVARKPEEAARHIAHMSHYSSSLGALPEKIRLDGFPIGYYYTSPHSLFVTTLAEGVALSPREDELYLAYGLGENGSVNAGGIRVFGGAAVSLSVENGRLRSLEIRNDTGKERTLKLSLSPLVRADGLPEAVTVPARGKYVFK